MTPEEALNRILPEIRSNSIALTSNDSAFTDNCISIQLLPYYLKIMYGIGFDKGRKSYSHSKKVIQYTLNGIFVKEWDSQQDIARFFKVSKVAVYSGINGKRKIWRGYKWEHVK